MTTPERSTSVPAKSKPSAAIQLLDLAWANTNKATDHSWERLNHSMRAALSLAIGAGFELFEGDIAHVKQNYRSGYWIGESDEWMYSHAIQVGNMSAVKSFEAYKKREPFIADTVELGRGRQRERLAVGFGFTWKGVKVKVTSFADDQSYLTACSYKPCGDDSQKIDKRFKITRADIIADRAERKERKALLDRLSAAASNGKASEITAALGAKNGAEFDALPIDKIRKIAEQFAPV